MKSIYTILWALFVFRCVHSQETEFTFGGASEEEDESAVPNITLSQGNNRTLVKSEMQFLHVLCNVFSSGNITFSTRWLDSMGRVAAPNNILFIKSLLKKDEGKYMCSTENTKTPEKKYNKTLQLNVTIPSISITILSDESLRIGGKIRRQCSDLGLPADSIQDLFTYTWLNQMRKPIGNSNILEIPIVDESVTGKYICQYQSKSTLRIYEAETLVDLKLAVDYAISITPKPATFQYGQPFQLHCEVKPFYKDISYTWLKNSEPYKSGQNIEFKAFDKNDIGLYKCMAELQLATGKMTLEADSTLQFTMFRQSKIELREKPGIQLFVHRGDKKELHCEIETNVNKLGKDAIWTINGKVFRDNELPNVSRLDRQYVSMLVITDINQSNEGKYECQIDSNVKEVDLIVLLDAGLIETSPSFLKVKEGRSVEFHCRAENMPNVKNTNLKWSYESKDGSVKYDIPDSRWEVNNPDVAEQTSFIELASSRVLDSGYYICTEPNGRVAKSELIIIPDADSKVITITPKEIRVRSNQRVDIECFSKNTQGRASGQPQFHFPKNRPIGRDSRFVISNVGPAHVRLTAPAGLSLSDNNMDILCSSGNLTASAKIYVKDICPPGYRYCQNGQCLENAKFCDKKSDCTDGSDEDPISCRECDPISKKCQSYKGEIPKKNYFLIHWTCDGEEDCGNGFDEDNCGDLSLGNCNGKYFTCSGGKQIPRGYLCDENIDCPNADDETGCTHPQIIKTSNTSITAVKSEQVTMTCEANGKPLPTIIWRFNWGCIQNSTRFVTRFYSKDCNTVSSSLVINNFKAGDDGIYNCEALNSRQRSFSNDFQVILQNN